MRKLRTINLLTGATATITGDSKSLSGGKLRAFRFTRGAGAGNTVFTVFGATDENTATPTYTQINTLINNAANAISEGLTRVASVTLSSDTSSIVWVDDFVDFARVYVVATVTTGGASSADVIVLDE